MSKYVCTKCEYLNAALKIFESIKLSDNCLDNLTIWIGASKRDKTSIETRNLYACVFHKLGINVLDCDFEAILDGREECDAILMFTITPGISARTIELIITSKHDSNNNKLVDKLHVYMPKEYETGYINRKISENLIAGKISHKDKILFQNFDKDIFSKCIKNLITISNDKKRELKSMEITFSPTILIVTALSKEFQAVKDLLKKPRYDPSLKAEKIQYPHYKIGNNDVVLAMAGMGNNFSSSIATKMLVHYDSIQYIIMVGIAGGIPNADDSVKHIRLGDIVISGDKGIIQHDFGKQTSEGHQYNFDPRPVCAILLRNAKVLIEEAGKNKFKYWEIFDKLIEKDEDKYKRQQQPQLNDSPWIKDSSVILPIAPNGFDDNRPRVHIGAIASGNDVIKEAEFRNQLVKKYPEIKAIEMEASGIADASWLAGKDSFVIRGICDYCNTEKNKIWQEYAAGVAAAFAIELIETL